jgi:hypothetical protein
MFLRLTVAREVSFRDPITSNIILLFGVIPTDAATLLAIAKSGCDSFS